MAEKLPRIGELTVERISDFSSGLNTTINGSLLNNNEAQVAYDVSFEQKGTIVPRKGRRKRYSEEFSSKSCTGIGTYYKQDGTSRLLVASDTTVYYDKPSIVHKWANQADFEKQGTSKLYYMDTVREPGKLTLTQSLLGKTGDCETLTPWGSVDLTLALDTANKKYNDNAIKATIADTKTVGYAKLTQYPDVSKYYAFSGWLKNGNASTGIRLVAFKSDGTVIKGSSYVTSTSYIHAILKLAPADMTLLSHIGIEVKGSAGQYAYYDGLVLMTVSEDDYNNSSYANPTYSDVELTSVTKTFGEGGVFEGSYTNTVVKDGKLQLGIKEGGIQKSYTSDADFIGTKTNVVAKNDALELTNTSFQVNLSYDLPYTVKDNESGFYSVSGGNGRRLVMLDNGWMVCVVNNSNNAWWMVSKDKGRTWTSLCYNTQNLAFYPTIVTKGTRIYSAFGGQNGPYFVSFDATTVTNTNIPYDICLDSAQTSYYSGDIPSIAISQDKTKIGAAWLSKNATYPQNYNIRYREGTINTDGSVTWESVQQVTGFIDGMSLITAPYVIFHGNTPIIFTAMFINKTGTRAICALKKGVSDAIGGVTIGEWGSCIIVNNTYQHSYPRACVLPNGEIHVVWQGMDSSYNGTWNIRHAKSIDGGNVWTNQNGTAGDDRLTAYSSSSQTLPDITCNKDNSFWIYWEGIPTGLTSSQIQRIKYTGAFSSATNVAQDTSAASRNVHLLYDPTLEIAEPLCIYEKSPYIVFTGRTTTYSVPSSPPVLISSSFTLYGTTRPVRLSNKWMVTCMKVHTGTRAQFNFYVSYDNGKTWNDLCYGYGGIISTDTNTFSITSSGTRVYILFFSSNVTVLSYNFDATTIENVDIFNNPVPPGVTYCSIVQEPSVSSTCDIKIDSNGYIHAVWCSKAYYLNMTNIRYTKSTNGGITWDTPIDLTKCTISGAQLQVPKIIFVNGTTPAVTTITAKFYFNGSSISTNSSAYGVTFIVNNKTLTANTFIDSNWTYSKAYLNLSYIQSGVYSVITQNGTIHCFWYGLDGTYSYTSIYWAYSMDNGVSWSSKVCLARGNAYTQKLPAACTEENTIHLFFLGGVLSSSPQVQYMKYNGVEWSAITTLTNTTTDNVSILDVIENVDDALSWIWYNTSTQSLLFGAYADSLAYSTSGAYESEVIDVSSVSSVQQSYINFTKSNTSAGIDIDVDIATSDDGGNTWSPWIRKTSGSELFSVGTTLLGKLMKYKLSFYTSNTLMSPILQDLALGINDNLYAAAGTWISNEYNKGGFTIDNASTVTWDSTNNGGTLSVDIQAYDDMLETWSEWTPQVKDAPLAVTGAKLKFRISMACSPDELATPQLTSLTLNLKPSGSKYGIWVSDIVDISQTLNKASGKAIVNSDVTSGQIIVYSRSSATQDGVFSPWSVALLDGTLTHPENNFVQLLVYMTDNTSSIDEITLSFDGTPTAIPLLSGLTPGAEYDFSVLKDTLIIVNGADAPRKWNAVDAPTLLGGSPPVFKMTEVHNNRLWGVEAGNPSRVRFSGILDPESWGALDFIDFNPEDGDQITCLYRYGQNLIVSKLRSMAIITGNMSSNYAVTWLDTDAGATGARALVSTDKYIAYVAQDGIRFSDLNTSILATERLLPSWDKINRRRLDQSAMIYWGHYLLVALPSENSLYNDTVWAYDFLRNAWAIYTGWCVSAWTKFHQYGEDILLACDSKTGQVYQVMVDDYDDTVPVMYQWRCKDFDFGYPERYKLFRSVYLDISGTSEASTLSVDLIVDGVVVGTYTTNIPSGAGTKYTRRILAPLYNAVLGRNLSLYVRGRCGIQKISIEYIVRGIYPSDVI